MNVLQRRIRHLTILAILATLGACASTPPQPLLGVKCLTPPPEHCPDKDCPSDRVINQGPVVEMKTRRTYFLDYPCDMKPGEKVTFVLALHGAGSYGNWQRNYFPLMDYKDKYRLVIATPNSPTHVWSESDDEYLHNIVDAVVAQIGKENVKAFAGDPNEKEFTVSRVNGDKSRFHVKRKQKIAQRERNRELVKSLEAAHKAPAKATSAKPKTVSA